VEARKILNELLVEVFNRILSIEAENMRKRGVKISMNEIHVLEAIDKTEEPTMTHIAKRLRITVGTLTTSISRLVDKGYVKRYCDLEDKRKVFLTLTKKAYEVLEVHDEFHDEMIDATIQDLNLEKDERLLISLENLNEYFKNKY